MVIANCTIFTLPSFFNIRTYNNFHIVSFAVNSFYAPHDTQYWDMTLTDREQHYMCVYEEDCKNINNIEFLTILHNFKLLI